MPCRQPVFSLRPTLVSGACLGLVLALGLATAAPAAAQARERQLYVSVLDGKNAPVLNLGPSDITVREDGAVREILKMEPATDPLQIALLIDDSQASTQHIQRFREGIAAFVSKMATGDNSLSIVTLADRPTLLVDGTTDAARLKKNGVDRLFARPGSGMYLLDAINDTAKGFDKKEATRPVIIAVLTEGTEFSNGHYQTTLDAIARSGAAFYALLLTESGGEPNPTRDEIRNRNVVLDRGTRDSGGRRDIILSDMAIQDSLLAIANELRSQYKVTYARPDRTIPPEKVTVEAKNPALTAHGQAVRVSSDRTGR
jgi:VWFA-related protein